MTKKRKCCLLITTVILKEGFCETMKPFPGFPNGLILILMSVKETPQLLFSRGQGMRLWKLIEKTKYSNYFSYYNYHDIPFSIHHLHDFLASLKRSTIIHVRFSNRELWNILSHNSVYWKSFSFSHFQNQIHEIAILINFSSDFREKSKPHIRIQKIPPILHHC